MEYYWAIKKNKILLLTAIWVDLEGIILNEITQRKANTIWYHLYVESKRKDKLVMWQKKKKEIHIYREKTSGDQCVCVGGNTGMGEREVWLLV